MEYASYKVSGHLLVFVPTYIPRKGGSCTASTSLICFPFMLSMQILSRNLPQVPFLTYALSLCFPSTLPSIFNGLAMASREKKTPNNMKNKNLRNPAHLGQVVRLFCGCALPVLHLQTLWMTPRGSFPVCASGVAHSTSRGTITITGAPNPKKTSWNPKHLEQ